MKKTIIIYTILIFIFGLIIGALSNKIYTDSKIRRVFFPPMHPEKRVDFIINKINKTLSLSSEQKIKIEQIITETDVKISKIRDAFHPQIKEILDESFTLIKKELNPKQQKIFEKTHKKLQKRIPHHPNEEIFPPPPLPDLNEDNIPHFNK